MNLGLLNAILVVPNCAVAVAIILAAHHALVLMSRIMVCHFEVPTVPE